MKPVILTGVPRSGTTLAAALLDSMPDAICLSEPDQHLHLHATSATATEFVAMLRDSLEALAARCAVGDWPIDRRSGDGLPITNYFSGSPDGGDRASQFVERVPKPRALSDHALICAKHNALYLSVLPQLVASGAFTEVAIVRDPIDVLGSWNSLALPVSGGKLPAAEKFWQAMAQLTMESLALLDKQVRIYELICRRLVRFRTQIAVIKYETLIKDLDALAHAVDRPLDDETRSRWAAMTRPRPPSRSRRDIQDALGRLVSQGEAQGLLSFYPQYG